jgi:hypothetical protein
MWSDELPDDDDDSDIDDDDDDDDDPDMPAVDAADSDDSDDGGGLEGPTVPQPAPSPAADPTKLAEPSASDRKALRRLRKAISDSHDRLVIVRVQDNPTQPATFRVGQVDWESSDPHMSERFGVYRVKWWRPHLEDNESRPLVECRFWPDVWTLRADGNFGHVQAVRPERARQATSSDQTLHWRYGDVSLAEDLIVGPFEFSKVRKTMQGPKRQAVQESERIDDVYWKILTDRAHEFGLDVSSIRLKPSGQ